MERNNSKQIVLSVLAIVVLVIAVVGVSFAMYSFQGTGTKENTITTATLSITYTEATYINLTNQFPQSDAKGFALARESADGVTAGDLLEFTVDYNSSTPTTVNYSVNFDSVSEGATLTTEDINLYVTTVSGANETQYNTNFGEGATKIAVPMSTYYTTSPAKNDPIIQGTFSGATAGSHTYVIRAWVNSDYNLPSDGQTTVDGTISKATNTETLTFKVRVTAA